MSPVFKKVFGGVLATGVALALLSFIAFTLWSAIAPKPRSPQDFARLVEEKKARQAEMRREAANTVPLANISGSNLTTRPTAPSSDTVKLQLVEKSERVPLATLGDETTTVKQAATSPAVAKAKPVEKVEPIPMATVTGTAPTTRPADTAPLLVATKREPAESVEAIPLATIGGLTGAASKGQEVLPASIVAPARSIQRPDVILPSTLATKPTSAVTPTVFAPNTETGSKTPIETAKLSAADRKPERIAQATLVDKDIRTSSHRASDARELLQPITLSAAEKSGSVKLAGVPATQPSDSADRLLVITLETIRAQMPPPLETQREKDEKFLKADQDTVKIVTGFDCATPLKIEKISPTHFAVTITTESDLRNWFMFRVEGVKGKTVRIDISGAPLAK
ncbi:MAG TPA: hypothetical protein VK961_21295, partial [Chthoniobacter sp.]|nr:hypothetical protein [Chthoniobacter sp.]